MKMYIHNEYNYTYMLNSNDLSSCPLNGLVDDPKAATCNMLAGTITMTTTML